CRQFFMRQQQYFAQRRSDRLAVQQYAAALRLICNRHLFIKTLHSAAAFSRSSNSAQKSLPAGAVAVACTEPFSSMPPSFIIIPAGSGAISGDSHRPVTFIGVARVIVSAFFGCG